MAGRLGGFRTTADRDRYLDFYDELVESWPVPHVEIDVATSFGSTRVRRSGDSDGVPLVLVHPTTGSSLGFRRLITRFCEGRTVYTPDTIGTAGRSLQTRPVRSAADLARWLDEVLDGLALPSVHLGGYSEGGWIAGEHAALTAKPARIASLSLVEPAGAIEPVPKRTLVNMVLRGASTMIARDKVASVRRFNRWMNGDVDLDDVEVQLLQLVFGKFRQRLPRPAALSDDELRRLAMPVLLLFGADTILYDPARAADRARSLLPNVEVEVYAGAGHGVLLQLADQLIPRILAFTANVDGAATP